MTQTPTYLFATSDREYLKNGYGDRRWFPLDRGSATMELRPEQIGALQAVRECGDQGYDTRGGRAPRAFTLAIINRNHPGLLTGFSVAEDPTGHRVKLTDRGAAILAAMEEGGLTDLAVTTPPIGES